MTRYQAPVKAEANGSGHISSMGCRTVGLGRAEGFSLVELMIAIVVLGILISIAVPAFRGWSDNASLKAAARTLSSFVYETKARASEENRTYRIVFNVNPADTYELRQGPGFATVQTGNLTEFGAAVRITAANIGGGANLDIQPRGTMGAGTVTLTNRRGSTATITLLATGRAHVTYTMQ